jgi:hypothetical protein
MMWLEREGNNDVDIGGTRYIGQTLTKQRHRPTRCGTSGARWWVSCELLGVWRGVFPVASGLESRCDAVRAGLMTDIVVNSHPTPPRPPRPSAPH